MMKLDNFVGLMTGHFDNKDQFKKMQAEGKTYPYAEHVNTICNDKINNLPFFRVKNWNLKIHFTICGGGPYTGIHHGNPDHYEG